VLAAVELALMFAFVASRRMWQDDEGTSATGTRPTPVAGPRRPMQASVLLFFFYGGVESGTGLWATSLLTMTRGASPATAGVFVAAYWGALTVGRFVVGAATEALGPSRLLRVALWTGVGALAALATPRTPLWFVGTALAILGFALGPVYPLAMHDTPARFGQAGARLVGYQVGAASLGIAVLPWALGIIGARTTPLAIPPLLLMLAIVAATLDVVRRRHG
jgi:fucose permease